MIYLRLLAFGIFCALVLMIAFAVTSTEASGPSRTADGKTLFQYDSSKPIELKEIKTETRDGVVIADIEYPSFKDQHGRIKAYLVKPAGLGSFAGVVFFHWLGETKSDRSEFLEDAVQL